MSDPAITLRFDGNGRAYQPGETLAGGYRLVSIAASQIKAIEVPVLWLSEGKGDEDLAVHEFHRYNGESAEPLDAARPRRFSTVLPQSPLSYEGVIVKLRWCVRIRVFLHGGREVVGQRTFQLGNVPATKVQPSSRG